MVQLLSKNSDLEKKVKTLQADCKNKDQEKSECEKTLKLKIAELENTNKGQVDEIKKLQSGVKE